MWMRLSPLGKLGIFLQGVAVMLAALALLGLATSAMIIALVLHSLGSALFYCAIRRTADDVRLEDGM